MEVLAGDVSSPGFALSWVPSDALRVLTWQESGADIAETLAAVAVALHLDLAFVPADEPWAEDAVRLLRQADVATAWAVPGVLSRVAEQQGWADVLRRTAVEPGALAFTLSEVLHDALNDVRHGQAAGADVFVIADDLAGQSGWLLAPDFALEALVPCYRQLAANASAPFVFHSDGDIRLLYPALAGSGFSAVHIAVPGDDAIQRSFDAARSSGLVPIGGIEARSLMALGASATGSFAGGLAASTAAFVCDDGGMTHAEELAAYTTALDAARRAAGLPHPE